VALAENRRTSIERTPVRTASLPEPRHTAPAPAAAPVLLASASQPQRTGFHLIPQAAASTLPVQRSGGAGAISGSWAIQVGAFGNESQARAAADAARGQARDLLASAHPAVGTVRQANNTLYRARLTGLSRDAAVQACEKLGRGRGACIVLSPEAQS
jgi:cell division septation protein DedD